MVPFSDLRPLFERYSPQLLAAFTDALGSGSYILGPQVERFESEFAASLGRRFAVAVASGTDAIELALRAFGVGAGDEVITVSHTAVATVAAIEAAGARPVLVDVDPVTATIDPAAAWAAVSPRTAAIVPVHLYGQAAAMEPLTAIAREHGLMLLEDCAQALGATYCGQPVGTFGEVAAFSFYPTKNLGGFGDAGAVATDDPAIAARLRRLRAYGQTDRYHHEERGVNSRMDEIQAAMLRVLLPHVEAHNVERRGLAAVYSTRLTGVGLPAELPRCEHAYHLYVIRSERRDALREYLAQRNVGTLIHYPLPVHLQTAYQDLGVPAGTLPVTERLASEILSLPLYIGLRKSQLDEVAAAVAAFAQEPTRA